MPRTRDNCFLQTCWQIPSFDFQAGNQRPCIDQRERLHHIERTLFVFSEMRCANMRLISGFIGINFENGNLIRPFFVSYGIKSQYTRFQPHRGLDLLFEVNVVFGQPFRIDSDPRQRTLLSRLGDACTGLGS